MSDLQIEVWSDVVCAWCGIGNHRLQIALERLDFRGEIKVIHRHFQLDPSFPVGETTENYRLLQARGLPSSQVHDVLTSVEQLAAGEGLTPYHVLSSPIGNTQVAHELLAFAADQGVGGQAWRALYKACFVDGHPFFGLQSLVTIASGLGLDEDAVIDALATHRFADRVLRDRRAADQLSVTGVPFYVINRKYTFAGAQSPDVLVQALKRARQDAWPDVWATAPKNGDAACGSDVCAR